MLGMTRQNKSEFQEELLKVVNSLYNLAYRLTQSREDSSDLVQEASLRGYRYFHKYETGTNFKAWMLTILRNTFINQYRKNVKEPHKVSYEEIEGFIGAPDLSGFEEEVFGEEVQSSIDQLPEDIKTAIVLFYVEEMSYKDMAQVMDCPMGTVMSRLHMGRQLMKKKLMRIANRGETRLRGES